jgi:anti-anti-sigma factor
VIPQTRNSVNASALDAQWRVSENPELRALLSLSGQISYLNAPELREILFRMIGSDGLSHLIVGLGALERIDTSGVAVLVEGLAAARASGQQMLLCEPSDRVRATFELAGLREALHCCCKGPREVEARLTADS